MRTRTRFVSHYFKLWKGVISDMSLCCSTWRKGWRKTASVTGCRAAAPSRRAGWGCQLSDRSDTSSKTVLMEPPGSCQVYSHLWGLPSTKCIWICLKRFPPKIQTSNLVDSKEVLLFFEVLILIDLDFLVQAAGTESDLVTVMLVQIRLRNSVLENCKKIMYLSLAISLL